VFRVGRFFDLRWTTHPQRHLIGVEVAFAVRLGAGMLLALAKLRGAGLGR
jgi:hypothetical protein